MGRRVVAIGVAALMLFTFATSVLAAGGTVSMAEQNNKYLFTPQKTYVNAGDSVTWKNGTDASHTVTSDTGGELASATVAAGGSFSHTFSGQGTFAYHCTIHPYMTGQIVVLAPGVTPPATDTPAPVRPDSGVPLSAFATLLLLGIAGALLLGRRLSATTGS